MTLDRIKILLCAIVFLSVFSVGSYADEKYSANECFEKFSRGTLKFNQALDRAIFKPVAKGYRTLPVGIRTGTSNALNNLSNILISAFIASEDEIQ